MNYIIELLNSDAIEEEDAELILTVVRKGASRVEKRLPYFISNFPNLAKNVYTFSTNVKDKEFVANVVLGALKGGAELHEYQLFWMGMMLEDYLLDTTPAADLLDALFSHSRATPITRAKILEIPEKRFGLPELRDSYLNTGQSDWLSWAAAVGSRGMKKASRNYKLGYFSKSSSMNHLIAKIVSDLP